jgi:hypothetical protein
MLDKLFALNLSEIPLNLSKSDTLSNIPWNKTKPKQFNNTLKTYSDYDIDDIDDINKSLKDYIDGLIEDINIKTLLIDNLVIDVSYNIQKNETMVSEKKIQINDYIIFDKESVRVVYYHGKYTSYMNYDFFLENECRIIKTKDSINFENYNEVCMSVDGNVLWGEFKNGRSKYNINKSIIPQINTRQGKIKMILSGL